jgi:hypothetical protein
MQKSCPSYGVVVAEDVPVLVGDVVAVVVVVGLEVAVEVMVVVVGVVVALVVGELVAVEVIVEEIEVLGVDVTVVVGVDSAQSAKVPSAYEPTALFKTSIRSSHDLSPRT